MVGNNIIAITTSQAEMERLVGISLIIGDCPLGRPEREFAFNISAP
jgi:hypothetical protein